MIYVSFKGQCCTIENIFSWEEFDNIQKKDPSQHITVKLPDGKILTVPLKNLETWSRYRNLAALGL